MVTADTRSLAVVTFEEFCSIVIPTLTSDVSRVQFHDGACWGDLKQHVNLTWGIDTLLANNQNLGNFHYRNIPLFTKIHLTATGFYVDEEFAPAIGPGSIPHFQFMQVLRFPISISTISDIALQQEYKPSLKILSLPDLGLNENTCADILYSLFRKKYIDARTLTLRKQEGWDMCELVYQTKYSEPYKKEMLYKSTSRVSVCNECMFFIDFTPLILISPEVLWTKSPSLCAKYPALNVTLPGGPLQIPTVDFI